MRVLISFMILAALFFFPSYSLAQTISISLKWEIPREQIVGFHFSPNGKYFILSQRWNRFSRSFLNGSYAGEIEVIETVTGKITSKLNVCEGKYGFQEESISNGNILAVSCGKGTAEIWDLNRGTIVQTIYPVFSKEILFCSISPDGKRLIATEDSTSDWKSVLYDIETGKKISVLIPNSGGNSAGHAAFSSDSKIVAVSYYGFIYLWDVKNGELIYKLADKSLEGFPTRAHFSGTLVYVMLFTPDGKRLITTSTDKFAKMWNLETGELEFNLGVHKSRIDAAALSSDGKLLAITGSNKEIEFWDVATGKLLQKFKAKSYPYSKYTFSPDNQHFFSATQNGASIWNVKTGSEIWNDKTERASLSNSWKDYLKFDKKLKKLQMWELKINK